METLAKNERVRPRKGPIMASIIMKPLEGDEVRKIYALDPVDVNYFALEYEWEDLGYKSGGRNTYVISTVDESNKSSDGYFNCTGIVGVGIEKGTGKAISFLTHQDPAKFLETHSKKFAEDLSGTLKELQSRCTRGSIDVVMFGGNYSTLEQQYRGKSYGVEYSQSVKMLHALVKKTIGIELHVISGPNLMSDPTRAILDTANRRMYIVKPDQKGASGYFQNKSFPASRVEIEEKRWNIPNDHIPGTLDNGIAVKGI